MRNAMDKKYVMEQQQVLVVKAGSCANFLNLDIFDPRSYGKLSTNDSSFS